jgi:hypothetical protein
MELTGDYSVEPWYATGVLEFLKQFSDGRTGDFGTVRDDTPYLTGTTPRSLQQWVQDNQLALLG